MGKLEFRSLCLSTDLDIIHEWVNKSYALRYWQLNGTKQSLKDIYTSVLENPHAHPFIALLDNSPVGQIDVYQILADELRDHIDAANNDCGLHLLMLPARQSKKNLSLEVIKAFIHLYFSYHTVGTLYAEPDNENAMANLLARKAGFQFLKQIELSYKMANLFQITPQDYSSNIL